MDSKDKLPKSKQLGYEALAAAFLVFGAVAFMVTFFPLINPKQYELNFNPNGEAPTIVRYCVGMIVSLMILLMACYFNKKAKVDR